MITAVVYLAATLVLGRSVKALIRPAAMGVILMLVMTLVSQRIVIPRMDVLRAQMGSVIATAAASRLRAEFDRLHDVSVDRRRGTAARACVVVFYGAPTGLKANFSSAGRKLPAESWRKTEEKFLLAALVRNDNERQTQNQHSYAREDEVCGTTE